MSNAVIERLQAERSQIEQATTSILDGIENRDLSRAEMETIERSKARIEEIDAQLKPLLEFAEYRTASDALTRRIGEAGKAPSLETRSLGAAFAASDQFRQYRWAGRSGFFEARALPTDLTDIAALLPKPATKVDITAPVPSPLLSLIRAVPVSQNAIETVAWTRVGGAGAAVVPEGTLKPLIEYAPTVVTHALSTIAGATQITRQMAEDAATVATYINGLLVEDVQRKAEQEAGQALLNATIAGITGTDLLKGIRKAIGDLQAAGYAPNAVLLNPVDWADIDNGLIGLPVGQGAPGVSRSLWGLTVVAANSQPPGTATVGDFSSGVQRYVRTGTSVYVTDSHADTFLENVFTILAETRQKTIVTRPGALREVTVAP